MSLLRGSQALWIDSYGFSYIFDYWFSHTGQYLTKMVKSFLIKFTCPVEKSKNKKTIKHQARASIAFGAFLQRKNRSRFLRQTKTTCSTVSACVNIVRTGERTIKRRQPGSTVLRRPLFALTHGFKPSASAQLPLNTLVSAKGPAYPFFAIIRWVFR